MAKNKNKKSAQTKDMYEPAIEDVKPPVVTGHDERYENKNGGRSTPNTADAPDGISGNWQ